MRKTVFIFIGLLFFLYSCNGQNKNSGTKKKPISEKKTLPQKDTMMEHFDIEKFNKNQVDGERSFKDDNGNVIRQLKTSQGFHEDLTEPNSYFFVSKSYYKNGVLAEKGLRFHGNGFLKGVWTDYDENGRISKQVDHDEPFQFTWENILDFMKKNHIDPADKFTNVSRQVGGSGPVWALSWDTKQVAHDGKKIIKNVLISGKTGKVSKEETTHFEY